MSDIGDYTQPDISVGYYNNNIYNVGYRRLHTLGYIYSVLGDLEEIDSFVIGIIECCLFSTGNLGSRGLGFQWAGS